MRCTVRRHMQILLVLHTRGPTDCVNGVCQCQRGFCFDGTKCKASPVAWGSCVQDMGKSCGIFPCPTDKGPTECKNGFCMCKQGYCKDKTGVCAKDKATGLAANTTAAVTDEFGAP